MRSKGLLAVLPIVLALLWTACGGGPAAPEEIAPEELSGDISFYKGPFSPDEVTLQENMISKFEEEYPNINVTFEMFDWPTQDAQITASLAAGTHNVVYIAGAFLPKFCYPGGPLVDLRPYVDDPAWKAERDAIPDWLWKASTASDGSICAYPYVQGPSSTFLVNKELLRAAGVPDDWNTSMEKVREAAIAVKTKFPDVYGIGYRTGAASFSQFDWYGYMLRSSANYLNDDFTACGMRDNQALLDTLQWLADLQNVDKVTPEFGAYDWQGLHGLWMSGKLAIMHDEFDYYNLLKQEPPDFEYDFVPIPGAVENVVFAIPGTLTINKAAGQADAAWELIKFLGRGDVLIPDYANPLGGLMVSRTDYADYNIYPDDPFSVHVMNTFLNYGAASLQNHPQVMEFQDLVIPLMDRMLQGEITPKELVDQACTQIEAKLK